jgi:LuxR family maltose regulon positive regulatory protein
MRAAQALHDDTPSPTSPTTLPFRSDVRSKVVPPLAPSAQVQRQRVREAVQQAGNARLVVVRAPAGFGKTTALLQLREAHQRDGVATAWLTLDAADNDATRFLSCLASAVRHLHGNADDIDVLDGLAALHGRFALFLDDFEHIHEPAVLAIVRSLIARMPRGGQLVVGSRSSPDLGLPALRAHRDAVEIDTETLRFDLGEAEEFFRQRGQSAIVASALSGLHDRTEGWIVALWLLSQAIQQRGPDIANIEHFSGSHGAIAEFLAEDVLARQTPEMREFLLRTSVLRHLTPELCAAVAPRADAPALLRALVAQNLCVSSLEEEPTYRYHSLIADFLRAQLRRERPDDVQRLHLAASGWYEDAGRPVPAIDHALEGGDYPHALELLLQHARAFLEEGRMRLLDRWFNEVPPEALRAAPRLQAIALWATLMSRGPKLARQQLERADLFDHTDPEVRAHVNALWPLLLAMQDKYDDALAAGEVSLGRLPTCNAFADTVLNNAMANVFAVFGRAQQAQALIDSARRKDSTFNRMYSESVEGMLDIEAGRLRLATARFRMAVNSTRKATYNHTNGNAWAGVLYAAARYQLNDIESAEHLVNTYLPLACDVGLPDHMITGYVIHARVAHCTGERDRAYESLTSLEYLGHHRQLPRVVATAKLERARLLLLEGDAQGGLEELDRAEADPEVWERVSRQRLPANETIYPSLARMRWEIHFGDAASVLPALTQEIAQAVREHRQLREHKLRMLLTLAQQRSGNAAAAAEGVGSLVRRLAPEGYVRLFVDEGAVAGRLVKRCHEMLQEMPARSSDPILTDYVGRLVDAFGTLPPQPEALAATDALAEPLTRKEVHVLMMVAEGHSNLTLAEKLGISNSTVRTHLRSISAKLHARNRAEAVAIGRRLGIVP